MRAVPPTYLVDLDQTQIGLVDQSAWPQRVPRMLATHMLAGQTLELRANQRSQLDERGLIAGAPGGEQCGHVRRRNCRGGVLPCGVNTTFYVRSVTALLKKFAREMLSARIRMEASDAGHGHHVRSVRQDDRDSQREVTLQRPGTDEPRAKHPLRPASIARAASGNGRSGSNSLAETVRER